MHLLSINIGAPRAVDETRPHDLTGIYKEPVAGPVRVTRDGLPGDAIISTRHHGGPDQAIYVYSGADYAWWSAELGQELAPGTFGENLTISDQESAGLAIGDRLHWQWRDPGGDRAAHPVRTVRQADGRSWLCETVSRRRTAGGLLPRRARRGYPGRRAGDVGAVCGRTGHGCRGLPRLLRARSPSGGHPPLSGRAACGSRSHR